MRHFTILLFGLFFLGQTQPLQAQLTVRVWQSRGTIKYNGKPLREGMVIKNRNLIEFSYTDDILWGCFNSLGLYVTPSEPHNTGEGVPCNGCKPKATKSKAQCGGGGNGAADSFSASSTPPNLDMARHQVNQYPDVDFDEHE